VTITRFINGLRAQTQRHSTLTRKWPMWKTRIPQAPGVAAPTAAQKFRLAGGSIPAEGLAPSPVRRNSGLEFSDSIW
jgi:hypothetical protein